MEEDLLGEGGGGGEERCRVNNRANLLSDASEAPRSDSASSTGAMGLASTLRSRPRLRLHDAEAPGWLRTDKQPASRNDELPLMGVNTGSTIMQLLR